MKNKQTNRQTDKQTDRQIYNAEQIYIYRDLSIPPNRYKQMLNKIWEQIQLLKKKISPSMQLAPFIGIGRNTLFFCFRLYSVVANSLFLIHHFLAFSWHSQLPYVPTCLWISARFSTKLLFPVFKSSARIVVYVYVCLCIYICVCVRFLYSKSPSSQQKKYLKHNLFF